MYGIAIISAVSLFYVADVVVPPVIAKITALTAVTNLGILLPFYKEYIE